MLPLAHCSVPPFITSGFMMLAPDRPIVARLQLPAGEVVDRGRVVDNAAAADDQAAAVDDIVAVDL